MSRLLYKELRLAAHPSLFVFMAMGALLLVPAYPYGVVFFFGTLGLFQSCMFDRETRDIYYTALLPVRKKDVVKGKIQLAVFTQMVQLALSLPFALLRTLYLTDGNPAGIEANAVYYGFGLMIYGVFNLVFFPTFFKTAYKAGIAFLTALVPVALGVVAMEASVHIPGMSWLDSVAPEQMVRQLPLLLAGTVVYAIGTFFAYRLSARRFELVNL